MSHLRHIVAAAAQSIERGTPAVLATVVKVQGSTYRRPGARMLIEPTGRSVGLVSGGCLDTDLTEQARAVLQTRRPKVLSYDSARDADDVWGLDLGCPGRVHVLLEPTDLPGCTRLLELLSDCLTHGRKGMVATVIRSESPDVARIAQRVLLNDSGIVHNELSHPTLSAAILRDVTAALQNSTVSHCLYEYADSAVEVLFETVLPPVSLVLFGGGPDAVPLARFAGELGWDVTVVDHRPAFVTEGNFPGARTLAVPRETLPAGLPLEPESVAVIMTHNFSQDLFFLKALLSSPVRYIGLLGPTSKSTLLLRKLHDEGFQLSEERRARLFTPVGLDIGSETPEEIAIAIVAEIIAVLNRRKGGFLRDRNAPIH